MPNIFPLFVKNIWLRSDQVEYPAYGGILRAYKVSKRHFKSSSIIHLNMKNVLAELRKMDPDF